MKNRNVVIIDDEPDVTNYLGTLLTDRGWSVRTANSADEGLAIARENPPDIVLLDLMMPERGGLSTLVAFRKDERLRSVRIVIVTGIDQEVHGIYGKDEHYDAYLGRLRRFHADAYLEKPVDPEELLATLEGVMETAEVEHV
jgi:twitching motility two-component system response regulator PilH